MRKFLTLSLCLLSLFSCQSESRKSDPLKYTELTTTSGEVIETSVALTPAEQEQGLSGVKPEDFEANQGMLFFYVEDSEKNFWMPDTYFDLDLFYLDQNLKVVDVIRKLPHYVGRANPQLIPRARPIWCRHVLEMKSTSPVAQKINVGDTLKWQGALPLKETELKAVEKLKNL